MKKSIKLLVAILMSMNLNSCIEQPAEPVVEEVSTNSIDIDAELQKIEDLRSQFQTIIKQKRYQDLAVLATQDFIGVGPAIEDWKEYQPLREEPMGMFSYDSIIMHPKETVIASDSIAYDFGHSNVYYTNADGKTVELENTFLVILKRLNGDWKLHREVASGTVKNN